MFLSYNLTNLNHQKRFFLIFEDLKRNPIQKDARKLASIKGNSLNKTLAKRNDFALPFFLLRHSMYLRCHGNRFFTFNE